MTSDEPEAGHDLFSYPEIAWVVELLPTLVREKRRRDGLSLRSAADQIGVASSTVKRFEDGAGIAWETVPRLLRWVGEVTSGDRPGTEPREDFSGKSTREAPPNAR